MSQLFGKHPLIIGHSHLVNLLKSKFALYTLQATWKCFREELRMNKLFINYISIYNSENGHLSQRFSNGFASGLQEFTLD